MRMVCLEVSCDWLRAVSLVPTARSPLLLLPCISFPPCSSASDQPFCAGPLASSPGARSPQEPSPHSLPVSVLLVPQGVSPSLSSTVAHAFSRAACRPCGQPRASPDSTLTPSSPETCRASCWISLSSGTHRASPRLRMRVRCGHRPAGPYGQAEFHIPSPKACRVFGTSGNSRRLASPPRLSFVDVHITPSPWL